MGESAEYAKHAGADWLFGCGDPPSDNPEIISPFQAHINYSTKTTQQICPGFFGALGETLAYIPYVQSFVTFLVGAIFLGLKCSKPRAPAANLGTLMSKTLEREMIEQLQRDVALLLEKTGHDAEAVGSARYMPSGDSSKIAAAWYHSAAQEDESWRQNSSLKIPTEQPA